NVDASPDQNGQLLQGLLLAFDRLIARGPTLLVVEDIHWADEASLDLLLRLTRSAATRQLLLLLTLRSDDATPSVVDWHTTMDRQRLTVELPLMPLGRDDATAMVHSLTGESLSSEVLRSIVDLTEGNPFFIEEVVRAAVHARETGSQPAAI